MKLVAWLAQDVVGIFGDIENPTNVKLVPIGQTQDASGYCGLCFEDTVPNNCVVLTAVPENTYYFIFRPTEGYWMTDKLVRFAAKELRQNELDSIVVTIEGDSFDGDEISQQRMSRTWMIIGDEGVATWTLADNRVTPVTGLKLKQALALAGEAQINLWIKYDCNFS